MNSNKKTARIVGVLFIIGTVAGVLSVVFTNAILTDPDYLLMVSAHENQIIMGAILCIDDGFYPCDGSCGDVSHLLKSKMKY